MRLSANRCFYGLNTYGIYIEMSNGALAKFLRRKNFDLVMFGYVRAVKNNFPQVSVQKIVAQYKEEFGIGDELDIETGRKTYEYMQREFMELLKKKCAPL